MQIKELDFCMYQNLAGIGMNDSPIGLLAWTVEKYIGGTDMRFVTEQAGHLRVLRKLSEEDLLTPVMVFWLNGNMLSAMRFYKENTDSELYRQTGK